MCDEPNSGKIAPYIGWSLRDLVNTILANRIAENASVPSKSYGRNSTIYFIYKVLDRDYYSVLQK